jgi:hypothetical protein
VTADWLADLSHNDWLIDGYPIRGPAWLAIWENLDWAQAYVDMGPSPAGNLGPYWHVPLKNGDTVRRLYPKLLGTKWLPLVRRAIEESVATERSKREAQEAVSEEG